MRQRLPKITLITPSYQQATYIRQCLESVFIQDYENLEYFVYDGGSDDGSIETIREYADQIDGWTSRKDNGQADAIAQGFSAASGEILGWLNSDDLLLPNSLNLVGNHFAAHPECQFLSGHGDFVNEDGSVVLYKHRIRAYQSNDLLRYYDNYYLPQPSVFFRKNLYNSVGGLDASLHFSMDVDLFLRMAKVSRLQIVDQTLSQLRLHSDSKTISRNQALISEVFTTIMQHARHQPPWRRLLHRLGFRRLMARSQLQGVGKPEGELLEDCRNLARSVLHNPSGALSRQMWRAGKRVVKRSLIRMEILKDIES